MLNIKSFIPQLLKKILFFYLLFKMKVAETTKRTATSDMLYLYELFV